MSTIAHVALGLHECVREGHRYHPEWRTKYNALIRRVVSKRIIHEFTRDGRLVQSFGEMSGPQESEFARAALSDDGKIACVPGVNLVVAALRVLPILSAYRITDGSVAWSDSLTDFTTWVIKATPVSYALLPRQQSSDCHFVLRTLSSNFVLSQSRRLPSDSAEVITTCVIDVRAGACVFRTRALPALPGFLNGEAIVISDDPFPNVRLLGARR